MKILISGGNGQLAYDCYEILKNKNEVLSFNSKEMDITNFMQVKNELSSIKPDIVLNCAAFTKVDACETEKDLATKVNVEGPKNLAQVIEKLGGKIIHVSTDYVFNGKKRPPESYLENDKPDPSSIYGKTKLGGERVIQKITDRYVIVRTAWMYGIHGHNFLKTILKLSFKNPKKEIKVVNDQFGSATWSYRLALQIEKLIEANSQGIYHAVSEGYGTWFDVAKYFLTKMNVPYKLIPCKAEEYPTPVCRPKNSILRNQRLQQETINVMTHWESDISLFVSNFRDVLINEVTQGK